MTFGCCSRLIEKEHEAHTALGDASSLMGKYDVEAEEDEIARVLAGQAKLDDVVKDPGHVTAENSVAGLLARIYGDGQQPCSSPSAATPTDHSTPFVPLPGGLPARGASRGLPDAGSLDPGGGLEWREYPAQSIVELRSRRPTCASGWRSCLRAIWLTGA